MVKNPPAMQKTQETWVQSLGWEGPLEEGMATHSSILAWKSHGQRSLVGCCPWGRTELDMTEATSHACLHALEKEMATHSSILAWKSHGQRSLVCYSSWACKELATT